MKNKINSKSKLFIIFLMIFLPLLITICSLKLFYVPTNSMEPTICAQDLVLGFRIWFPSINIQRPYFKNKFNNPLLLSKGDIIAFEYNDTIVIKRIVGLPGDTITIQDQISYVNNIKEPNLSRIIVDCELDITDDIVLKLIDSITNGNWFQPNSNQIYTTLTYESFERLKLIYKDRVRLRDICTYEISNSYFVASNTMSTKIENINLPMPSINSRIEPVNSYYSEIIEEKICKENCVFVLGDNRMHSLDSRVMGDIPIKSIKFKIYPIK